MKQTADPIHVLYPAMNPDFQHDYEEIRLLLASPSNILLCLGELEVALSSVREDDSRLVNTYKNAKGIVTQFDGLEVALQEVEQRYHFSSEVVHISPGGNEFADPNYGGNKIKFKEWTAMLQGGHPFRDYGASRPHGEITHRIQWYLICAAHRKKLIRLSTNGDGRIIELYRATSLKEHRRIYHRMSDDVKYTKSVWSDLFDFGLTKIIDGRSTIWIQRELLFLDWRNYFPKLSGALSRRFVARGGSLDPWHIENRQFFNGSAMIK